MPTKPNGSARPVPIRSFMMRRVFLQGNKFVCGICRKAHSSADEANLCLQNCWQIVLKQAPWTSTKRMGKTEFHCAYCQRTYDSPEAAANCASDCAEKMTITSHEAGTMLGTRAKRTFGPKPPVKITLKMPYKVVKSAPEPAPGDAPEAHPTEPTTAAEAAPTTPPATADVKPAEANAESAEKEAPKEDKKKGH